MRNSCRRERGYALNVNKVSMSMMSAIINRGKFWFRKGSRCVVHTITGGQKNDATDVAHIGSASGTVSHHSGPLSVCEHEFMPIENLILDRFLWLWFPEFLAGYNPSIKRCSTFADG